MYYIVRSIKTGII